MCAPDDVGASFTEPEIPYLALVDQLADGASHVLDRHVGVHAMLVQHVDAVSAEVAQAALGDLADVFRPTVQRDPDILRVAQVEAELGSDHDIVTEVLHRAAE